jgi:hypothetical protein
VAIAEVDVERRALGAGSRHHGWDRQLVERSLMQQLFRRVENLAFGLSRIMTGAPTAGSG